MLRELHIQNLAVIQDITIDLCPHLNCFTGQTGAGKSLIIGALEILLALRQPTDMLRKGGGGAVEGRVSAVFHINSLNLRQELASATDLPLEQEPELVIARRIFESGRTSASINGHPITGAMLKHVGEILVDVHGQHDAQFLLKPANQLAVLDDFGDSADMRRDFSELYRQGQELLTQQQELGASRTLRRQQLELYEFQAKEIDDAQLSDANEHEQLTGRARVLANVEKIKRQAAGTYAALYEEEGSIIERLKIAMAVLAELSEMDDSLGSLATQVKDATVSLDDAAFSLRRYVDRLDLDPAEMAEVNERLNLLNRLIDKYGGRTAGAGLQDVLAYREQIGQQIVELKGQDQDLSASAEQIVKLEKQLREIGAKLTAARKKAAAKLIPLIHDQLADLGMKEAEFKVEFTAIQSDLSDAATTPSQKSKIKTQKSDPQPAPLAVSDFSTSSGFEAVEFMIAPNPGQPARPLRRIASGGELSRVMLALKSILAQRGGADRVSVLVFDEVDANVGGRMGSVIGKKLRALANIHQVLCITHLPQIAAFADRHLTIRKATTKGQTTTTVTVMDGEARLEELAEMTVGSAGKGPSETSLAQAKELLEAANGRGRRNSS